MSNRFLLVLFALFLPLRDLSAQEMTVAVDATDAPRRILHAHMNIPVSGGTVDFAYPEWIPGEHSASGPVAATASLHFRAGTRELQWNRNSDMFTYRVDVPPDARSVEVDLDYISPMTDAHFVGSPTLTPKIADLKWNEILIYPAAARTDALQMRGSIKLPAGWKYATALTTTKSEGGVVSFAPVSLSTFVDSPLVAGENYRRVDLLRIDNRDHRINFFADSAGALDFPEAMRPKFDALVMEAGALFGSRHYRHYDWLVSMTDLMSSNGLEHHESSDNQIEENTFATPLGQNVLGGLLAHEYVHSWNGKYRRPAGLVVPNYQSPMNGELLWAYEGMTQHLGRLLAERAGLWTPEYYRDYLAYVAGYFSNYPGRSWRSLEDTARSVGFIYGSGSEWGTLKRRADYYNEANLAWIEADMIIRQVSGGKRSLDDFTRSFFGGGTGAPEVKPYVLDDLIAALNAVAPYDWRAFVKTRFQSPNAPSPASGFERGGWKLLFDEKPNVAFGEIERRWRWIDLRPSLGLLISEEGSIIDAIVDSPAWKGGLAPGMKVIAVNRRKWTSDSLRAAVDGSSNTTSPIDLLAENGTYIDTYHIDYHGGARYPHLVRDVSKPDLLSEMLKARSK